MIRKASKKPLVHEGIWSTRAGRQRAGGFLIVYIVLRVIGSNSRRWLEGDVEGVCEREACKASHTHSPRETQQTRTQEEKAECSLY